MMTKVQYIESNDGLIARAIKSLIMVVNKIQYIRDDHVSHCNNDQNLT